MIPAPRLADKTRDALIAAILWLVMVVTIEVGAGSVMLRIMKTTLAHQAVLVLCLAVMYWLLYRFVSTARQFKERW